MAELVWVKASASAGQGACVEVAQHTSGMMCVLVRDSKHPAGAVLHFTAAIRARADARDADSPGAASARGQSSGVRYARGIVRTVLGVPAPLVGVPVRQPARDGDTQGREFG